jgi:signal transduction histidine kinase
VPILGYIDVILSDPEKYGLNAEGKRLLDLMMWSARNEERIVNRILEYSMLNVEKETVQPHVCIFSPRTIIDVIIDSNHTAHKPGLKLRYPRT